MADRRRRRALEDEGEEKENVILVNKERPSECESEGDPAEPGDIASEYESAAEDNRDAGAEEESEEGSEEETEEETEEGSEEEEEEDEEEEEEEYTDDDVIIEGEEQIEERQSGDGEEQPDKENIDDDEDKKNPAYVPRKGAFYEHDLRTGEEDVPEVQKPKKKLWQDEGKWSHDRFHEDMQAPKSREELMALYGYDIRAADKPPEAPPPRMRGRGRGRPQRQSKLSDFMEPKNTAKPQPEIRPQRMVVIDTTEASQKPKTRPPPPPVVSPGEAFDEFDEDIDVPYMTTIDTTQSSADGYMLRGQRRRGGGGPRQRRDQQWFEEKRTHNNFQSDKYQERKPNRERQSYADRNRGRPGHRSQNVPSQDARFSQPQDAVPSVQQGLYSQDYPALNSRTAGPQAQDSYSQSTRSPRSHEDFRNRNNRNMEDDADVEYDKYSNLNRSQRGGSRGGYQNLGRGRERNDRNNRPPRYSRLEREERQGNSSRDLVQAKREFTNSSFRNAPPSDSSTAAENNGQLEKGVEKDNEHQTSQDVVISNKENVQTISVTITNTTMERKSYAKDRRGKSGSAVMGPSGDVTAAGEPGAVSAIMEGLPQQPGGRGDQAVLDKHPGEKRYIRGAGPGPRQDSEQSRPKRYSSQRQRNMLEYGYGDPQQQQAPLPPPSQQQLQPKQKQVQQQMQQQSPPKKTMPVDSGSSFYNQVYPPGHPPAPMFHPEMSGAARPPPPPQDPGAFSTAMLQPPGPMSFHLPVSGPGMPTPPRLMGPNMAAAPPGTVAVPISNASPQLLPAPYLAAPGVIYSAPPPPPGASPPYQVPLGYTSPPPTAPPPTLAQASVASPQAQPEVHRGGTVYFPPYLQQPASRSPARRQKVAIPIVDPTELKKKNSTEGSPTLTPEVAAQEGSEKDQEEREKAGASYKPKPKFEPAVLETSGSAPTDNSKKSSRGESACDPLVPKPDDSDRSKGVPDNISFQMRSVQDVVPVEVAPQPGGSQRPGTSDNIAPDSSTMKGDISQIASKSVTESTAGESLRSSTLDQSTVQISETVKSS